METPLNQPSRLKKIVRRTLFVLAAVFTLAALALAEESWRGARAWQNYKRAMEAKGEHFDAARLIPKPVPDDQNFAMTPYLAPIFNLPPEVLRQPIRYVTNKFNDVETVEEVERVTNYWGSIPYPTNQHSHHLTWKYALAADLIAVAQAGGETNSSGARVEIRDSAEAAAVILDEMKFCEPTLAELRNASRRPFSQFSFPWEEWNNPHAQSALMAHFPLLKGLCQIFSLHAKCELVLGRTDMALDDINAMFRIDDAIKDEPVIISQLVRMAGMAILLQPVGEGLAEQRWWEDQLRVLQEHLQKTDLLASTVQAFHGERDICGNPNFDMGYIYPSGWNRLEQLNINRVFQETVFPQIDLAAREVNPSVNHSIVLAFQESHHAGLGALLHHKIMATMLAPALFRVPEKAALAQSEVDMAMLACALERHRLALGQYPEDLNALVPRFVAVLPHDIINSQPLKYHRTANGKFILYSVGWNEKDDGGVVAATKTNPPRQDPLQGDWVWQYPE